MTQEEIISMALKADCYTTGTGALITEDIDLERFFNLTFAAGAAHEREACAKVCDEAAVYDGYIAANCAAAIRARGK